MPGVWRFLGRKTTCVSTYFGNNGSVLIQISQVSGRLSRARAMNVVWRSIRGINVDRPTPHFTARHRNHPPLSHQHTVKIIDRLILENSFRRGYRRDLLIGPVDKSVHCVFLEGVEVVVTSSSQGAVQSPSLHQPEIT